jgi:mRNA interferase RelE/StbE
MRLEFPPHVAAFIRRLPPDVKRSVREAARALSANPELGEPLRRELEGLWRYRVRRFRIVYRIERRRRTIVVFAVGHRRTVYEELADRLRSEVSASVPKRLPKRK